MKNKLFLLFIAISQLTLAQSTRITDNNSIAWFVYNGTFKLNPKISLHTEFQWRRDERIKDKRQNWLRFGIN